MKTKLSWGLFFLMACLTFKVASSQTEINGKVVSVIDGNTIEFLSSENESFKLILTGIDCPELDQDFGEEAKQFLETLLFGKEGVVLIERKDRMGNRVGSIQINNQRDPRQELLENGLAWTTEKNSSHAFDEIKVQAKHLGKGLWSQKNPTAPWVYRRQQSMLIAKSS